MTPKFEYLKNVISLLVIFTSLVISNICSALEPSTDICAQILSVKTRSEQKHLSIEAGQKLFSSGVHISADDNQALIDTPIALNSSALVIYNAAFKVGDKLTRASVLHRPNSTKPWQLTVIIPALAVNEKTLDTKMSRVILALKENHIKVASSEYMFLNKDFENDQPTEALFIRKSFDSAAATSHRSHNSNSDDEADEDLPALSVMNITWIPRAKRRALLDQGITDFAAVLEKYRELGLDPTPTQLKMLRAFSAGKTRFVDTANMSQALKEWDHSHPLIYLDFETVAPEIPRYPKTRPMQQVPFQFSVEVAGQHFEYLHSDTTDPRPNLIAALLAAIPKDGSVVAYNKSFEASRLEEMAEAFPNYAKQLNQIRSRLVDPLPILRKTFYDLQLHGSFSLKSVAPALFGPTASYKGLEIEDGLAAQAAYDVLISSEITPAQKQKLMADMLIYCAKDTEQMRLLVEWMIKVSIEEQ